MGFESSHTRAEAVKKTEKPQAKSKLSEKKRGKEVKKSSTVWEKTGLSDNPKSFDKLRTKFSSDYDACFFIAKNIAQEVSSSLQGEYYSLIRGILAMHPRAKKLTYSMTLSWYDYHYNEEPSKLLTELALLARKDLPKQKERLSLILSLLQSGYTSESSNEELDRAVTEILNRRDRFKKRIIAGSGVALISLEDSEKNSPKGFTNLASKLGTKVSRINSETATDISTSFSEAIAKSDSNIPLTLVLTVHGMAQEGGYIALPNDQRFTPRQFAQALKKRGRADNVTILSTQCYPRSSRAKDSFFDNLRKECLKSRIGLPMVYMESMEDQPAVYTSKTNPSNNAFQTLRHVSENCKTKNTINGADILVGSEDVLGNQPSLIIPSQKRGGIELNNDLAYAPTGQSFRNA